MQLFAAARVFVGCERVVLSQEASWVETLEASESLELAREMVGCWDGSVAGTRKGYLDRNPS